MEDLAWGCHNSAISHLCIRVCRSILTYSGLQSTSALVATCHPNPPCSKALNQYTRKQERRGEATQSLLLAVLQMWSAFDAGPDDCSWNRWDSPGHTGTCLVCLQVLVSRSGDGVRHSKRAQHLQGEPAVSTTHLSLLARKAEYDFFKGKSFI